MIIIIKAQSDWRKISVTMDVCTVALILGVKNATVRRWAREGRLPAKKIGKMWLFDRDNIRSLIEQKEK